MKEIICEECGIVVFRLAKGSEMIKSKHYTYCDKCHDVLFGCFSSEHDSNSNINKDNVDIPNMFKTMFGIK